MKKMNAMWFENEWNELHLLNFCVFIKDITIAPLLRQ